MMRAMRWFEYNIRSIFYFLYTNTHTFCSPYHIHSHPPPSLSLLSYGFSSIQMVLRISRACFILKYNFDQNFVHFFCCCLFHFEFGRFLLILFFHPHFGKSPVTKRLVAFFQDELYAHTHTHKHIRDHHHHACVFFMLFLPYGHAEPLITFLLRTHFFANITTLNITTKRNNNYKRQRDEARKKENRKKTKESRKKRREDKY